MGRSLRRRIRRRLRRWSLLAWIHLWPRLPRARAAGRLPQLRRLR